MKNSYKKILLNSARNCLMFTIHAYQIKEISIPYYICPVIWQELKKENIKINFYKIDKNFMPAKDFSAEDYILYPNYFGICSRQNSILVKKYKNLISDNAHAFFAKPTGLAAFYSPRKFFNVNDGGILFSQLKDINLNGYKQDENRILPLADYQNFVKNELSINNLPIKIMSPKTQIALQNLPLEQKAKNNKEFFQKFHELLTPQNRLDINLTDQDIPMNYPFLTENTDLCEKIIKTLSEKNIYIIKFGPDIYKIFSEYNFRQNILLLPLSEQAFSAIENYAF